MQCNGHHSPKRYQGAISSLNRQCTASISCTLSNVATSKQKKGGTTKTTLRWLSQRTEDTNSITMSFKENYGRRNHGNPDIAYADYRHKQGMSFDAERHYENTPMQHTAVFHGCKNGNFQLIFFLPFSYFCSKHRLWVHVRTDSLSTHNLCLTCLRAKIRKTCNPIFYYIKVGCKGCTLH